MVPIKYSFRFLSIFLIFLFTASIFFSTNPASFRSGVLAQTPSTAANISSNNSFPAAGSSLYANSQYNVTQLVRDPTSWNRTWDSANLAITWNGNGYANDSTTSGVYNATYSFESDAVGSQPAGFTSTSTGTGIAPSVVSAYQGHNHVVKTSGTAGSGTSKVSLAHAAQATGNISIWAITTNAIGSSTDLIIARSSTTEKWGFALYAGVLYYNDASVWHATALGVGANVWTFWTFSFNAVAGKIWVYQNGVLFYTLTPTGWSSTDNFWFGTDNPTATFQCYFDAIDLSWDSAWYANRASWMLLNCSETFTMTGSYAFRYSVWSGGAEFFPASWVSFSIIDNVQLISNAPIATTWLFTNNPTVNTLYDADFSKWQSNDYSNFTYSEGTYQDSFTDQSHSTNNYDGWNVLNVETTLSGPCGQSFIDIGNTSTWTSSYFHENETRQLEIGVITSGTYLQAYATTYFNEMTLNWDNQPSASTNLWGPTNVFTNTRYNVTIGNNQYINFQKGTVGDIELGSELSTSAPIIWHNTSKFYVEPDLGCIQSNDPESLTFSSDTFAPTQLQPGDMLNFDFNTSSTHQIVVELLNGGIIQSKFELSREGNPIFTSRDVNLTLVSPILIDQLRITGIFDAASFQITDLTIERDLSNEYSHTYYISAYSSVLTTLPAATYNLRVFQGNVLSYNVSVAIQSGLLNPVYYQPNSASVRQVAFFDTQNNPLAFSLFLVNLTCTYQGETFSTTLFGSGFSATFYADDESYYSLYIYDRFGHSLFNRTNYAISTFINITLTNMYSLKIQNNMQLPTLLQLTRDGITQSEYALSNEILEYMLWNGTYQLNYTQSELNQPISLNIDVTSASIYNISTAYHSCYISAFSVDGLGVPVDSVRLYVNGSRQAWGPVETLGLTNITVLDYINDTEYSNVLDLSQTSEMNIFINIATVITTNFNDQPIPIAIWKNTTLLQNVTVPSKSSLSFRFTNGHYTIWNGTENQTLDVLASGTDLTTYTVSVGSDSLSALYSTQLYAYAAFGDIYPWSSNVTDDYAAFYSVVITSHLSNDSTVYFDWNGNILAYQVPAMNTYPLPLYVPKTATYRIFNGETGEFESDSYIALSMNATSGQVLLTLGTYAPIPDYTWTTILPVVMICVGMVAFFVVYMVKFKRKSGGEYR